MRLFSASLMHATDYLKEKGICYTGYDYKDLSGLLEVRFKAGVGRALINVLNDSPSDIEEIIDVCIKNAKYFDIGEYQSPSMHEMDQPYIDCMDSELLIIDGKVNKDWAIAVAKHFNLNEKELKQ